MADMRKRQPNTPVYGNLAYDLDALVREHNLEHAGRMDEEQQYVQVRRQPRTRSVPRTKAKASPLLIGSVVLLAAMVIGLMIGYVQLTEASDAVTTIRNDLSEAQDAHVALVTKYEQTFDMTTVKERAEAAGMRKPSSGQIEYIDISGSDAVVIYQSGADGLLARIFTTVKEGIGTAVEYFK